MNTKVQMTPFEKGSVLVYVVLLLIYTAAELVIKKLIPSVRKRLTQLKQGIVNLAGVLTNGVKSSICFILQLLVVLASGALLINAIALVNIIKLQNKLDRRPHQEISDLKEKIKTYASNQVRQLIPRWLQPQSKKPSYKQIYEPFLEQVGVKDTSSAIVHISAGAIIPISTPFSEPPPKQFPAAPTHQELNKMSVRSLQTLCDRINKTKAKSIQGYRRKGVNKRLIIQKITSFYAGLN